MSLIPDSMPSNDSARHRRTPPPRWVLDVSKYSRHVHTWGGVLTALLVTVIGVSGIMLNHKRGLGLMPEVEGPGGGLVGALSLEALGDLARAALDDPDTPIDRMDVRPDDGLIKVRFDDPDVTEVTVALHDGTILHVGPRRDVFMEKLHSGEILGDGWILLSDAAAVALIVLLATGFWLWLMPRFRG